MITWTEGFLILCSSCGSIFFGILLGALLGHYTFRKGLERDGYWVNYDASKKPGEGRYIILRIPNWHENKRKQNETSTD